MLALALCSARLAAREPLVSRSSSEILAGARALADDVLFPAAIRTDRSRVVPEELLDALAGAGLYGLVGPRRFGGLELDPATADLVVEELAGGCLTTTFVWIQHHNSVGIISHLGSHALQLEWLPRLCTGELRAGVAFSGLRRPGPPILVATPVAGGVLLDGLAPFVSGWGRIDLLHIAARLPDGDVVWLLADAYREGKVRAPATTVEAERLDLAALDASATVSLRFARHPVPEERMTLRETFEEFRARDEAGLRRNGALSLGVARRCLEMLPHDEAAEAVRERLTQAVTTVRAALAAAGPSELPAARALAVKVAVDAATTLIIASGGASLRADSHVQRLGREALFLLIGGQTRAIREAQLSLAADVARDS